MSEEHLFGAESAVRQAVSRAPGSLLKPQLSLRRCCRARVSASADRRFPAAGRSAHRPSTRAVETCPSEGTSKMCSFHGVPFWRGSLTSGSTLPCEVDDQASADWVSKYGTGGVIAARGSKSETCFWICFRTREGSRQYFWQCQFFELKPHRLGICESRSHVTESNHQETTDVTFCVVSILKGSILGTYVCYTPTRFWQVFAVDVAVVRFRAAHFSAGHARHCFESFVHMQVPWTLLPSPSWCTSCLRRQSWVSQGGCYVSGNLTFLDSRIEGSRQGPAPDVVPAEVVRKDAQLCAEAWALASGWLRSGLLYHRRGFHFPQPASFGFSKSRAPKTPEVVVRNPGKLEAVYDIGKLLGRGCRG